MIIANGPEQVTAETHPLHPKNPDVGVKAVLYAKELYLEEGDAVDIEVGEKVTLMKWGNAVITRKETSDQGRTVLHAELRLEDTDFKKTKKLHWVAKDENTVFEVTLVELDHLITKRKIEEDDEVADIVNRDSYIASTAFAEGNMRSLQRGDIIQLERRGYFYVDKLELGSVKMTLNFVPDGKARAMSKIEGKLSAAEAATGKRTGEKEDTKKEGKKKKGGAAAEE